MVRGTPLAFQLFVVYFVLPEIGLTVSGFWSGVIVLAVNYSAYEAEIFRLGLQAIPHGQMEAALSLGMSRPLALRRILLPQAVRIVIPASANDFIALFKDTADCSVIAVEELSKQYSMGAKSTGPLLEMALRANSRSDRCGSRPARHRGSGIKCCSRFVSVEMVFQQFNLFPHLSVLGNVIEAPVQVLGHSRDETAADAQQLLVRVGLGDRLHSYPHQLSGGEQQRVAIASALAMHPELILFDLPTSALDPRMTAEILDVMTDLAKVGQTMLVVTHAMGFARRVANAVYVIAEGVIAESGPPQQVFENPLQAATREFLRQAKLG